MPTYDYKCNDCGHKFEHCQSMTSDKLVDCPECNEPSLVRLIGGGGGFIFKGDGWAGKTIKRENEDQKVHQLANKAKRLKMSGKVKMDDHLSFNDVKRLEE